MQQEVLSWIEIRFYFICIRIVLESFFHQPEEHLLFWQTYKPILLSLYSTGESRSFFASSNVFEPKVAYSYVKEKVLTGIRGLPAILIGKIIKEK